jgi:membrane-associated phospholipid phosphatase
VLLGAYPLAMGFALVYGGEHYVADVLAGYLYAVATFVSVNAVARRLSDSRRVRAGPSRSSRLVGSHGAGDPETG